MKLILALAGVVGIGGAIAWQYPEIKRYLKVRSM
jgi:hypothetical protein